MKSISYPGHRRRPGNVQPCGTMAAYRRHMYWGEIADQACCDAVARLKKSERDRLVAEVSAALGSPVSVREAARFRRQARGAAA